MEVFLINNEVKYTYTKLMSDLSYANSYFKIYKTNDLYLFFLNFIVALINDKPLILVDSDINDSEADSLNSNLINKRDVVELNNYESFDDIVERVINSQSEITIYTSGTTGQPKEVIHSVQTLTKNVRKTDVYKEQIWAFAYNPTHMGGLQVFFQAFLNSNTLINVFNQSRDKVYSSIDRYTITHISATPTFFRLLLPYEKSYESVIRVTLGGEKSDNNLFKAIELIFPNAKINNIYASTEAGYLFSAKGEFFQIPDSMIDKIMIMENELYIHKSLLGKSDSFQLTDDYYCTGDLVEWENENERLFRFKGRANELINVGGYKVNTGEVEAAISQLSDVIHVVVYGKASSVLGNILCADVILRDSSLINELSMREYLKNYLQDFKIPRRIKFVDNLTLTRTGKIKRL